LFDRLIKYGCVGETESRVQVGRLMHGLKYFHGRGIVHRDLKPENLLMTTPFNEHSLSLPLSERLRTERWKISDFGLSQLINKNERLLKVCGTWAYSAPQAFDPHRRGYDCRFDDFSMGVVTYVILSGSHPFDPSGNLPVNDIKARAKNVIYDFSGEEWRHISNQAKDFVSRLMAKDDEMRMTADEAINHPWISGIASPLVATPRSLSVSSSSSSSPQVREGHRHRHHHHHHHRSRGADSSASPAPAGADVVRVAAISGSSMGVRSQSPPASPVPARAATTTVDNNTIVVVTAGSSSAAPSPRGGSSPATSPSSVMPRGGGGGGLAASGRVSSFLLRRHGPNIASPISPDKAIAQGLFSPPASTTGAAGGGGGAFAVPIANVGMDLDAGAGDEERETDNVSNPAYRHPIPIVQPPVGTSSQRVILRPNPRDGISISRMTMTAAGAGTATTPVHGLGAGGTTTTPLTGFVTANTGSGAAQGLGGGRGQHKLTSSHFPAATTAAAAAVSTVSALDDSATPKGGKSDRSRGGPNATTPNSLSIGPAGVGAGAGGGSPVK
jgi:serine/threonine protein kinase